MLVKQLSIFLQNKPGHLADITEVLKAGGIDIRAINVSEGNEFGILKLIVDDIYKAQYLLKEAGYLVSIQDVLAIEPQDRIGMMNDIFRSLSNEGISIEYIYSIIRSAHEKEPTVILKTSDQDRVIEIMKEMGITLLSEEEIANND